MAHPAWKSHPRKISIKTPSVAGAGISPGLGDGGFGVFWGFFVVSRESVVADELGIGARCASSAPRSHESLFQRMFLIIPMLIFPVLAMKSHTTPLEPLEGQSRVEKISKGQQSSVVLTLFRSPEVQREGL